MDLTYRDLFNFLQTLPKERMDDSISILDAEDDEYYPVFKINIAKEDDVIEKGSVILNFRGDC